MSKTQAEIKKELAEIQQEIQLLNSSDGLTKEDIELAHILERELILNAKEDLYTFLTLAWQYAGTRSPFKDQWYVQAIVEHLEALYRRETRKLAIAISPRKGKSTLCSVIFPVWCWLDDPRHQFLTVSYGQNLSTRDALYSRRLIESNWFQKNYGQEITLTDDQNLKTRYENTAGGRRLSTSVTGGGTGEGSDILTFDDPHKASEARSEKKREAVIDSYVGTFSNRYNDPDTFAKLIVHQRVHHEDLIGYVLKEEGDWDYLCLPEEYEGVKYFTSIGWEDPRTRIGELLAPAIFNEENARNERLKGEYYWSSQFQQNPVPREGGIVKKNLLNYYLPATKPDKFDIIISAWDLANGGNQLSDYSVGQVWGKKGNKKYLLHQVRGQLTFPKQINAIKEVILKFPLCQIHLIEKKSNGQAAIDTLKERGGFSGIIAVDPKEYGGDKESRLLSVLPDFEARDIYIPDPKVSEYTWVKQYIEELTLFPKYKYDDAVDATSYALGYFFKHSRVIAEFKPELQNTQIQEVNRAFGISSESLKQVQEFFDIEDF